MSIILNTTVYNIRIKPMLIVSKCNINIIRKTSHSSWGSTLKFIIDKSYVRAWASRGDRVIIVNENSARKSRPRLARANWPRSIYGTRLVLPTDSELPISLRTTGLSIGMNFPSENSSAMSFSHGNSIPIFPFVNRLFY